MPLLFVHITNFDFHSLDDGAEYDCPETALAQGVHSAVVLLGEEITRGKQSAAIEVRVEQEDGTQVLRSVVALSVSPLRVQG